MDIYKPNPGVKGCGASFSYSAKQACVFLNLIQQLGWDKNQKGPAKGWFRRGDEKGKEATIKFSIAEAGLIKECLRLRKNIRDFNNNSALFHTTDEFSSTIDLVYYSNDKSDKSGVAYKEHGFTFTISKKEKSDPANKLEFRLPLTLGEAAALGEFLTVAIQDSVRYEQREKERKFKEAQLKENGK